MNANYYASQFLSKLDSLNGHFDTSLPVSGTDLSTIATNTTDISSDTSYIEDHTNNILTNLGILTDCVTSGNKLKTNFRELNDHVISANSGTLEDGTLRVCIATDDVNLSAIKTAIEQVSGTVNMAGFQAVDIATINGTVVQEGVGASGSGVQRVVVANDDTNLSAINTAIVALNNLLQAYAGNTGLGLNVCLNGINFGASEQSIPTQNGNITEGTMRICIADDDTNLSSIKSTLTTMSTNLQTVADILTDVWDSTAHSLRTV